MAAATLLIEPAGGHDVITTKLTWSKEVSRVVYKRCLNCHREGAGAFSLALYSEARPWAKAIQETVLRRRMPPWDAVKGFGQLQHDRGLSQEEIHILSDWVEGGAPEGDPALLPDLPKRSALAPALPTGTWLSADGFPRSAAGRHLLAIDVSRTAEAASFKLVAESPGGEMLPLLWIEHHSSASMQGYELAQPVLLAVGSRLKSYPPTAGIRVLVGALKPPPQPH